MMRSLRLASAPSARPVDGPGARAERANVSRIARAAVLVALLASSSSAALAQSSAFRYRPEKSRPGTVYHYTKSNRDKTQAWRLSVFVASSAHVDVLKWDPNGPRFVNVEADMDWTRFMPDRLTQRREEDGRLALVLAGRLAPDGRALLLGTPDARLPPVPFRTLPTHVYGFDLVSLNLAMRHLVDPTRSFEVGLVDPNKPATSATPGSPFLVGTLAVKYVGEEDVRGARCRKYLLAGSGLENKEGFMWVDKRLEHVVKIEHPVRTSTDWTDFRLELDSVATISDFEWDALKREVIEPRLRPTNDADAGNAPASDERPRP